MARLIWVFSLLLASNAAAWQKDKPAPSRAAVDPMAEAEAKIAAGDNDGAAELLRKRPRRPPPPASVASPGPGARQALEFDTGRRRLQGRRRQADRRRQGRGPRPHGRRRSGCAAWPRRRPPPRPPRPPTPKGAWPRHRHGAHPARGEGKGDEALALAQKAAAAGGGAAASVALGLAQEARGDLAAAEAAYRAAARRSPSRRWQRPWGWRACCARPGRAAEAEPLLKAALDAAPGDVNAYKESARVKIALGRGAEAMGDAATAAALAENDPEAKQLVHEIDGGEGPRLPAHEPARPRDPGPDQDPRREPRPGGGARGPGQRLRRQAPGRSRGRRSCARRSSSTPPTPTRSSSSARCYHLMKRDAAGAVPAYEKALAAAPGNLDYRTPLGAALLEA